MASPLLDELDATPEAVKRAQWEAFEFTLTREGVRVRNCSHDDPGAHEYQVRVGNDGIPTECDCPAFEYQDGACKHMIAVAIRVPVLMAASGDRVRPDGGLPEGSESPGPRSECWCADSDLPCFAHFAGEE